MPCAIPMCAKPCPEGWWLALNDQGCETCNCYDPCQGVECERGSKCVWTLQKNREGMSRPAASCSHEY